MHSIGRHLFGRYVACFVLMASLPLSCFAAPLPTLATVWQCTPIDWRGILTFFLLNYVAHAATVPGLAGATWWLHLQWSILSLFLPFAGLGRALGLLWSHFLYNDDDIGKAIAQGAIAVARRSKEWKPLLTGCGEPKADEELEGFTGGGEMVYVSLPDNFDTITTKFSLQTLR